MTTNSILAKLGAMTAAVTAPAMLFLGAGTAQANMTASGLPPRAASMCLSIRGRRTPANPRPAVGAPTTPR